MIAASPLIPLSTLGGNLISENKNSRRINFAYRIARPAPTKVIQTKIYLSSSDDQLSGVLKISREMICQVKIANETASKNPIKNFSS